MEKNYTIMVVEDESLLLQAIANKLSKTGFNVVSCSGGSQALDYLQNLPQLPDVIWLDYYLKDMNGLEFMSKISQDEKTKMIPVLIVSNSASPEKVKSLLALGAKKYVLKAEHRLEDLVDIVEEIIKENAGA